jgi:hypothetical protein
MSDIGSLKAVGLKILIDDADQPKYVLDKGKGESGMSIVAREGDTIEWTTKDKNFTIDFDNPPGAPFNDWNGDHRKPSRQVGGGPGHSLSGTISASATAIVYKYTVVGPSGKKLDPRIIVDH